MIGAIFKATNSSFQKGMTFCRSIYVKKVMKLLAFIFEQPSYNLAIMLHLAYLLLVSTKRYKLSYKPIDDSDQPVNLHSLARVFDRRLVGSQWSNGPLD